TRLQGDWSSDVCSSDLRPLPQLKQAVIDEARRMHAEDIAANQAMGRHGTTLMPASGGVLTHCNAGALATCGYGTALGVIRAAVEIGRASCRERGEMLVG